MTEESHKRLFPEVDDVPSEDASAKVHNLAKLSSKLRELLEESQDAVLTSRQANLKCHNELETMRLSAMRQNTDLVTMKERLEASENSCRGLREQLECANSHIKQLQAGERKSRSLRDSAGVEISLAMREKEDGLEELRRQLFREQDMVRLKEEQIVKVRSEREDSIRLLQNQVAADENQLRHYERLTNGLREQLKERHEVEKKLQEEINDFHTAHSELKCELLSTRNDLQIAQSVKRPKLSNNDSPYVPLKASDVKTILEEACAADVTDEATALLHELDAKTFALAKCRQKLAEKHLELDSSMTKVESLTVEAAELRREFIRLDDSNQRLAESVESLKAEVASKEGDHIDLQCKNQTLIRSMHPVRAQNKEMCNQLAVSNVTCEALLEMLSNAQVPESAIDEVIRARVGDAFPSRPVGKMETMYENMLELNEELNSLKQRQGDLIMAETARAAAEFSEYKAKCQQMIDYLQQQNRELEAARDAAIKSLVQREKETKLLREKLDCVCPEDEAQAMSTRVQFWNDAVLRHQQEVKSISMELDQCRCTVSQLEEKLRRSQELCDEREVRVKQYRETALSDQRKVVEIKEENECLRERLEDLKSNYESHQRELIGKQAEIDSLKVEIHKGEITASSLQARIEEMSSSQQHLRNSWTEELSRWQSECDRLRNDLTVLDTKYQAETEQLRARIDQERVYIDTEKRRSDTITRTVRSRDLDLEDKTKHIESLTIQLAELKGALSARELECEVGARLRQRLSTDSTSPTPTVAVEPVEDTLAGHWRAAAERAQTNEGVLRQQLEVLQNSLNTTEQAVERLQAELNLAVEREQTAKELTTRAQQSLEERTRLETERLELSTELATLKDQAEQHALSLASVKEELTDQRRRNEQEIIDHGEDLKQLRHLEDRCGVLLAEKDSRVKELTVTIESLTQEVRAKELEVIKTADALDASKDCVQAAREEVLSLTELLEIRSRKRSATALPEDADGEVRNLQILLGDVSKHRDLLLAQQTSSSVALDRAMCDRNLAMAQMAEMNRHVETLNLQLEEVNVERIRLDIVNAEDFKGQTEKLKLKVAALERSLHMATEAKQEIQKKYQEVSAQMHSSRHELKQTQCKLHETSLEIARVQEMASGLEAANSQLAAMTSTPNPACKSLVRSVVQLSRLLALRQRSDEGFQQQLSSIKALESVASAS